MCVIQPKELPGRRRFGINFGMFSATFLALYAFGPALAEEPGRELDRLNHSFEMLGKDRLPSSEPARTIIPGATSPLPPWVAVAPPREFPSAAPVMASTELAAKKSYEHNGSLVERAMLPANGGVKLTYSRPRAGMEVVGVAPGTVLFEGSVEGQRIIGKAYAFKRACPPAAYDVTGEEEGDRIVLRGSAPIRNQPGCKVQGYSDQSPNAELVFAPSVEAQ